MNQPLEHEKPRQGGFAARRQCCCGRRHGGPGALAEPAALAALLGKAAHGYDLRREIVGISRGEIDVDAGGLYRALRRLEEDGFVTSCWSDGGFGPQRREYALTAEGRELALDWVAQLRRREHLAGLLAGLLEQGMGNDVVGPKEGSIDG